MIYLNWFFKINCDRTICVFCICLYKLSIYVVELNYKRFNKCKFLIELFQYNLINLFILCLYCNANISNKM